jgi:heme oxygenase
VREILHRRASRFGYALFLRNLLPAYEALEEGLERMRLAGRSSRLSLPELYRRDALRADLEGLCGSKWSHVLPLLPAAEAYGSGVAEAAIADPARLLAHAYVRYLGDLNGGQTLRKLLAASLGLGPEALAFYSFPRIEDLGKFKLSYRQILDETVTSADGINAASQEAERAFRFNISVSEAVLAAAGHFPETAFASPPSAP